MIFQTKTGYSVELLCRARDHIGEFYLGLGIDNDADNPVFFDFDFTETIPQLLEPIEVIKRLLNDQTINTLKKREFIHLLRAFGNLNETENRLSKLFFEKLK